MERVQYNCRILAEAMQLSASYGHLISDKYIDTIALAAPLCDLGNVAVPLYTLKRDEELTAEELEQLKKHTMVGAEILKDIKDTGDYNDYLQVAYDIAKCHHENWDGSGYPEGIKGEQIPLAAQIVTIVSAYCTLTQDSADGENAEKEKALEIMGVDAGTKFNPDIFDILKKIVRQLH